MINTYSNETINKLIDGLFLILLAFSIMIIYKIVLSLKCLEKVSLTPLNEDINKKVRLLWIIVTLLTMYYLFIIFKKYKSNPDQNSVLIFLLVIFVLGFALVKLYLSIKDNI